MVDVTFIYCMLMPGDIKLALLRQSYLRLKGVTVLKHQSYLTDLALSDFSFILQL